MDPRSLAAWVRRHTEAERLLAAWEASDVALALAAGHALRANPASGPREIRAWIRARQGAWVRAWATHST